MAGGPDYATLIRPDWRSRDEKECGGEALSRGIA